MMVGIRSGAGAQPHTQDENLVEEHRPNPESSEDDDNEEGIPHTSPSKSTIDPTIRSLDHRRTLSQQPDDQSLQTRQFKRRRIGSVTSLGDVLSSTINPARARISRKESSGSSPEDIYVPAGLVNSLNAALRKGLEGSQPGVSQVNGETNGRDNGYDHADHDHENIDEQEQEEQEEQQGHVVANASRDDEAISEDNAVDRPTTVLEPEHTVQDSLAEDQVQADVWDVPVSPEKTRSLNRPDSTSSSRELSRQDGRTKSLASRHCSEPIPSSQPDRRKTDKTLRSSSQGDRAPSLAPVQSEGEAELQEEIGEDVESDETFKHIDGSSQSEEYLSDIGLPTEESFARDVASFKYQYPEGFEGDETYEGPPEDDKIATHIDSHRLKTALHLMRHNAWGGFRKGWRQWSFDINSPETRSVRVLLKLLTKFERLLAMVPRAHQLVEQNKFLNEYSNILSYYFSEIKSVLKCIREKREKQESDNTKLHSDIISHAIPMLFHVLASAWELGGHDWKHTSFTISTIELLMRTLGWIGLVYRPLFRRLSRQPLNSPKGESKTRRVQREKREELEEIRKDLCRITGEGIDALGREEHRQNQERQIQEENLIREEELMAQRRKEEEAMMISIRERQRRSLLSIRAIRTPLSESSRPSSRQMSSVHEAPPQEPAQVQTTQLQPSRPDNNDWSLEEKTFLFKKIQESYPDLVDLDDVRWEINRTLEETEAMAEELLGLMLKAVHPDQAVADRDAHIHEIMQAYRRTWGHER
ncbi:uncharacterized protein GGS22DRAFT_154854 [Annulohypoxylon maeteangense]|uniref:uncharacterized protein n=1 Tax=Annulohypoxylon maeteangense TaxID=1927788 RepID=UPI002007498F|nr:uncharacterized protein GGS22DRAFT_154854 [Annulohypoxylon maeteangense]KAI0888017.1 hypothetical protein GGS22DRAFT_154854 [Annulohypoxylon maeteangense]